MSKTPGQRFVLAAIVAILVGALSYFVLSSFDLAFLTVFAPKSCPGEIIPFTGITWQPVCDFEYLVIGVLTVLTAFFLFLTLRGYAPKDMGLVIGATVIVTLLAYLILRLLGLIGIILVGVFVGVLIITSFRFRRR